VIYLDYHATTPVDRRVADCIHHYMTEEFGNASSTDHAWGDTDKAHLQYLAETALIKYYQRLRAS